MNLSISPLVELIQKSDGFRGGYFLGKISHDVGGLLPYVHCLLVLGLALEDQNIRHSNVVNEAISLELLADLGADGSDGDVELVDGDDFGGRFLPISIKGQHAPPSVSQGT